MDFNTPSLSSLYSDMLNQLKARDVEIAKMFDGSSNTNVPVGAIRFNSTNARWEKYDGTTWNNLLAKYSIDVDKVDGCNVNDTGTSNYDLWTAAKILALLNTKVDSSTYNSSSIMSLISSDLGTLSEFTTNLG